VAAREVVERLRLGDPTVADPVGKLLCGAFAGPGSRAMVVVLWGPGNTGFVDWVVFRWAGGAWQFLMKQPLGASITAAGSDIRQTLPIYRPADPRCCPSGGTKTRIWRWNGSRLVAGPWKQVTKGEPGRRAIYSPSRNLFCDLAPSGVICSSSKPERVVSMGLDGQLTICRGIGCIGNPGEDVQPIPTLLAYGRQITVGLFRCLSLTTGVRCTVIRSGKGFLISRDGVSRVGP
jgi:hypothetical protein